MDSILKSVKKLLLLGVEPGAFDEDVILHTNAALLTMTQLGIGPAEGFAITGGEETWTEFLGANTLLESVKACVAYKVKMAFDPPTSTALIESMNRLIGEYEWRINVAGDKPANETCMKRRQHD